METAGRHLIADLWGCNPPQREEAIRELLLKIVEKIGATLLSIKIEKFSPMGITGVAIIAESHISIHTWPEHRYVAVDIFTCGSLDPLPALAVLRRELSPEHMNVTEIKRGIFF